MDLKMRGTQESNPSCSYNPLTRKNAPPLMYVLCCAVLCLCNVMYISCKQDCPLCNVFSYIGALKQL